MRISSLLNPLAESCRKVPVAPPGGGAGGAPGGGAGGAAGGGAGERRPPRNGGNNGTDPSQKVKPAPKKLNITKAIGGLKRNGSDDSSGNRT
jgi:hypothetical protein